MQDAFKPVLFPENRARSPRARTQAPPHERTAAMTAAIFLISLNLLLVGSLALRRQD